MKKELHPTGALCKTPQEADPRDYQSEYVLGLPTNEELNNLPRKIDMIGIMEETWKQWSVWSCTAMWICHTLLSMKILNHKRKDMFIDYKYQRTHNQWKERITNSGWDYLENAARTLKNNWVKGTVWWKDFLFEIDWYAVEERWSDFEKMLKMAMWHMSKDRPIYRAIYGNSKTRQECSAWEIKTIWSLRDGWIGWHAIEWWGIDFDRRKVKFANSWSWNSKNNDNRLSISSFEIDFDVFEQLLNNNVFNRRRWILYNKKDIPMEKLFDDFVWYDETSEQYKAVKRAKDNGIIKWVPTDNWFRLEPNRAMTRLEMLLVLYRLYGLK